ncbi:YpfB family protein [Mesobacillus maritimus]|uniref:YpfB family protein n=1 Tax=Mesobacillus maritimus TaxID=1643336 RepID=UPI00384B59F3
MKTFERILIKLVIIQFAFLFITQLFFHQLNVLPELKVITQYEGVVKEKNTESVETIWENQKAGK